MKLKKVRSLLWKGSLAELPGKEGSITSALLSFLPASISAVIAISITNSLAICGSSIWCYNDGIQVAESKELDICF